MPRLAGTLINAGVYVQVDRVYTIARSLCLSEAKATTSASDWIPISPIAQR
ncbi:MAG: hypothetical protein RLP02_38820 [Coleofasciculus sp. C2-GNP5-27]